MIHYVIHKGACASIKALCFLLFLSRQLGPRIKYLVAYSSIAHLSWFSRRETVNQNENNYGKRKSFQCSYYYVMLFSIRISYISKVFVVFDLSNSFFSLVSYSMIAGHSDDRVLFRKVKFHYVVFDEAHMLKNMETQRYQSLMKIKVKDLSEFVILFLKFHV